MQYPLTVVRYQNNTTAAMILCASMLQNKYLSYNIPTTCIPGVLSECELHVKAKGPLLTIDVGAVEITMCVDIME